MKFEVNKSTGREPNTASVSICNLSKSRRDQLAVESSPQLELAAGYKDLEDTIFVGDARDIWSERDGADVWTTIEAEDGGRSYRTATIEQSFAPNTPVITVLRACADAMGVGIGNADSMAASARLDNAGSQFAGGTVLSGQAWRQLDRICRSCSLRWSVQSGVLQLRQAGQPAETRALRIAPSTGMLGSPKRGTKDERSGKVAHSVRTVLIPDIYPGRVVSIESSELEGAFMVTSVSFVGESTGPDWYAELEIQEY